MAYSKKAIRHMPAQTRKFARLVNELDSTTKRLRNLINASLILPDPGPTSAKQLKHKPTLALTDKDTGDELFPGDIPLAVSKGRAPLETTTETEARELARERKEVPFTDDGRDEAG